MRLTIINALLVVSTATAASIPRQPVEQPQIVLADLARSQLGHQQPQATPLPPAKEPPAKEEKIKHSETSIPATTVTKTTTVAMTTATVIRTETVSATPTKTPKSSSQSSSSSFWSWSLKDWLWGGNHCKEKGKEQHVSENEMTKLKGLGIGGLIDPKRLAEGMGCFCSAGSVCCYNSNAQVMCNHGSCGVI